MNGLYVSGLYCARAARALKTKYSPVVDITCKFRGHGDSSIEESGSIVVTDLSVR